MFTKTSFVLILAMLAFNGCSQSSSGNGAPDRPVILNKDDITKLNVENASSETGEPRVTVLQQNLSNEDQTAMYTIGCKKEGVSTLGSAHAMDKYLAAGQVFRSMIAGSRVNKPMMIIDVESKIRSVNTNSYISELNYLQLRGFGNLTVNDIFTANPHSVVEYVYEFSNNGFSSKQNTIEMNVNSTVLQQLNSETENQAGIFCYIKANVASGGPSYKTTVDRVQFDLGNSRVNGFRKTTISSGEIVCQNHSGDKVEIPVGLGFSTSVELVSNEVVSTGVAECGGTQVLSVRNVVTENGNILTSSATRLVSAPIRK